MRDASREKLRQKYDSFEIGPFKGTTGIKVEWKVVFEAKLPEVRGRGEGY